MLRRKHLNYRSISTLNWVTPSGAVVTFGRFPATPFAKEWRCNFRLLQHYPPKATGLLRCSEMTRGANFYHFAATEIVLGTHKICVPDKASFDSGSEHQHDLSPPLRTSARCFALCGVARKIGCELSSVPQDSCWAVFGHEEKSMAEAYGQGSSKPQLNKWIDKIGF
jgi:hypothetical protein